VGLLLLLLFVSSCDDEDRPIKLAMHCSLISSLYLRRSIHNPETICVVTSDGRLILGQLVGHDQVQNLILKDAKERVYSDVAPPESVDLGLYVIRGDNVCMVADYDEKLWLDDVIVPPLPPVQQQENYK
jgi:U6 snRNA-associated Sm-like protein LSm8